MKIIRLISFITFLVIALVIGGITFFLSTFDANLYREQIISLVNKQTGRKLSIDGDLKLGVFPDIAIEMGKTSLSNAPGFTGKQFATIGSARVSVNLLPLLKKQIRIDKIQLHGLNLNLHRKANGATNWDDLTKKKAPEEDEPPIEKKPANKVVKEMLDDLSVAGISLKDARIHWQDDQTGKDITLSPVNLKTGAFKPGNPLPVDLTVGIQQKNPAMNIQAKAKTTVTLSKDNKKFSLANLKLQSIITGEKIPGGALNVHISGNIKAGQKDITAPDLNLIATLNGDLIPQGEVNVKLSGNMKYNVNTQLVSISGLKLDSTVNGNPLQGGKLNALLTGNTQFNLANQKLSIPNLSLNTKLAGGMIKGGAATTIITGNTQFDLGKQFLTISGLKLNTTVNGDWLKGGNARSKVVGDLQINLAQTQLKMPTLSVNTLVHGGLVPGGNLNQLAQGNLDINWGKKQGSINLSGLQVRLADLQLKGSHIQIQPLAEKPSIKGHFQTNTFNLKKALKILGIAPPETTKPQALSQVQAQFSLQANTENATLEQLKLKLDQTLLTGKLTVKNFSAPSIQPELKIDHINVDDYLAPDSNTTTQKTTSTNQTRELFPLTTLRGLDINGGISIGSMIVNKLSLSNINTRIKAKQGLININPANASLYKGQYQGKITLDARQAIPSMKMHHELTGLRSEGLLFDLFADKYISGDTRLVTDFSSKGNTLTSLLQNLNGTTSIAFKNGTIRDSKLANKVSLAVEVFEKKEIKGDKSVITFTGLSGDWKTTNGVFKTDNLSLKSPYFHISGIGTADVAKQMLDMKLRIGPNQKKGDRPLFAPLHIYGSFTDPKFKLDLKDLVKALAQQDLDKAKQKAREKLKQAEKEAREKLKQKEREARARLKQKEQAARAKLNAQKQALQARLDAEKKAKEQQLRKKVEEAKAKAMQQIDKKIGGQLGDQIKDRLGDSESMDKAIEKAEDKLKNKLKDGLRGLF